MDWRKSHGSSPSRSKRAEGVVSFTLKATAKSMQPNELLAVTPEALIAAILRRREQSGASLPEELVQRQEEYDRAHERAKQDKEALAALQDQPESSEAYEDRLQKARHAFEESETFRRRTVSRLQLVEYAIKDHAEATEFWAELIDGAWGHLLEDAERVKNGGLSSYAINKEQGGGASS